MIIPAKFQWSKENDPDNSSRINNITKKYNTCLKKFGNTFNNNNNKSISNKDNQDYYFQKKVLDWFFNLSFIDRVKVSSINNKWVFQTLHQLYIEQNRKNNLRFIPRFMEKNIPFMQNLKGRDIFFNNPSHFLNYFAFSSENYEIINGYDEKIENEFLNEIIFFYPDLTKIAKIKQNGTNEDLIYLLKYYYPILTLSESILNSQDKFKKYFKTLSNNYYFIKPPEIISSNRQKEMNNDTNNENNNINNSFNSLNPLNNFINTNNNTLNENNLNQNNNININYNNKIQNIIDLPIWAKQPIKSKICFSVHELFLAFFEQNIIVYYILYFFDKQFYETLISDNINKNLEEFLSLKNELKDFLCINKEDLLNLLNIDIIIKEIYFNPIIDKFVDFKKYQNVIEKNTKFWKENKTFEEEYNLIKDFFNCYNNDNKSMNRLINDISMFNIEQIYSFEDFFLNKILFNLNKKYENNKNEDLIYLLKYYYPILTLSESILNSQDKFKKYFKT